MAFLSFIYRHGIWISIPAFGIFIFLLVHSIVGVVRTGRQSRLFSVPLAEKQEVAFADAGRIVLAMEGPILSRRFVGLEYGLEGPDGREVRGRSTLFPAKTTGFSKATMELKVFDVEIPGRHVFHIRGLSDAKPSDAEHRMIFSRPHLGTTMLYVIGIVFSSIFTILSIVLFFLRLAKI